MTTGSLRERRRQLLREEIIEAARELMGEKGHEMMGMDEVAAHAGISKPTLYSHFATKEELVLTVAMQKMEQIVTVLEAGDNGLSPLKRLSLVLHKTITFQVDEHSTTIRPWKPELFQFLCHHETSSAMLDRIDERIVSLAEAAIVQGEVSDDLDLATFVRTFYAILHALNTGHFSKAGDPDPVRIADRLTAVFLRGVERVQAQGE
jgi:AcrR family transcriptional regulator